MSWIKQVEIFNEVTDFEECVNRPDINILKVDIKVMEPNFAFQQGFAGIVYFEKEDKS
jgi:hypothetical protein